jgi:hypothetical protein
MVRKTKIISENFQEAVYRLDILGAAVAFVNWHKNSLTIDPAFLATPAKFPRPGALQRINEKIQNVKRIERIDLYGGEKV